MRPQEIGRDEARPPPRRRAARGPRGAGERRISAVSAGAAFGGGDAPFTTATAVPGLGARRSDAERPRAGVARAAGRRRRPACAGAGRSGRAPGGAAAGASAGESDQKDRASPGSPSAAPKSIGSRGRRRRRRTTLVEVPQLAVRDRDAAAEPRAAEPLALEQAARRARAASRHDAALRRGGAARSSRTSSRVGPGQRAEDEPRRRRAPRTPPRRSAAPSRADQHSGTIRPEVAVARGGRGPRPSRWTRRGRRALPGPRTRWRRAASSTLIGLTAAGRPRTMRALRRSAGPRRASRRCARRPLRQERGDQPRCLRSRRCSESRMACASIFSKASGDGRARVAPSPPAPSSAGGRWVAITSAPKRCFSCERTTRTSAGPPRCRSSRCGALLARAPAATA